MIDLQITCVPCLVVLALHSHECLRAKSHLRAVILRAPRAAVTVAATAAAAASEESGSTTCRDKTQSEAAHVMAGV